MIIPKLWEKFHKPRSIQLIHLQYPILWRCLQCPRSLQHGRCCGGTSSSISWSLMSLRVLWKMPSPKSRNVIRETFRSLKSYRVELPSSLLWEYVFSCDGCLFYIWLYDLFGIWCRNCTKVFLNFASMVQYISLWIQTRFVTCGSNFPFSFFNWTIYNSTTSSVIYAGKPANITKILTCLIFGIIN